jgi:hypothetical protein
MPPDPARRDPEDMSQATGVNQSAAVDRQAPGLPGTYLTSNSLLTSARALTSGPCDSKASYQTVIFSLRKSECIADNGAWCRSASHSGE